MTSSEKTTNPDSELQYTGIILKPINPSYEPIILTPEDENEVGVIAEFVEVLQEIEKRINETDYARTL